MLVEILVIYFSKLVNFKRSQALLSNFLALPLYLYLQTLNIVWIQHPIAASGLTLDLPPTTIHTLNYSLLDADTLYSADKFRTRRN